MRDLHAAPPEWVDVVSLDALAREPARDAGPLRELRPVALVADKVHLEPRERRRADLTAL